IRGAVSRSTVSRDLEGVMSRAASFEGRYRELRAQGARGWGGDGFAEREQLWKDALHRLGSAGHLPPAGTRALELGSGSGMVSEMLVALGYEVEGIDLSETAVAWAREGVPTGRFVVGDVTDLRGWADSSRDLVVDGNCLHCLLGDERTQCLAEVRRVLVDGGGLLVSSMIEPTRDLPAGLELVEGQLVRDGLPVRTLLPRDDLIEELRLAGFAVQGTHRTERERWDHLTLVMRSERAVG
ncbi:MAG: class I SAM-dependent methyltransferase, partial [Myxococcota bacterium]